MAALLRFSAVSSLTAASAVAGRRATVSALPRLALPTSSAFFHSSPLASQAKGKKPAAAGPVAAAEEKYDLTKQIPVNLLKGEYEHLERPSWAPGPVKPRGGSSEEILLTVPCYLVLSGSAERHVRGAVGGGEC
jgi:hypothetical protein